MHPEKKKGQYNINTSLEKIYLVCRAENTTDTNIIYMIVLGVAPVHNLKHTFTTNIKQLLLSTALDRKTFLVKILFSIT